MYIFICTRCESKLEEQDRRNGSCPFCYPRKPVLLMKEIKKINGTEV